MLLKCFICYMHINSYSHFLFPFCFSSAMICFLQHSHGFHKNCIPTKALLWPDWPLAPEAPALNTPPSSNSMALVPVNQRVCACLEFIAWLTAFWLIRLPLFSSVCNVLGSYNNLFSLCSLYLSQLWFTIKQYYFLNSTLKYKCVFCNCYVLK